MPLLRLAFDTGGGGAVGGIMGGTGGAGGAEAAGSQGVLVPLGGAAP